jgi:hypothetical protein
MKEILVVFCIEAIIVAKVFFSIFHVTEDDFKKFIRPFDEII